MRRTALALVFCATGFAIATHGWAQSGSNGVYGGYVASDAWFAAMRSSAENQAMLRQLGGDPSRGAAAVPPDYVEVAGQFTFPAGNPFPGGRIADLRIKCANQAVDNVTRGPFVSRGSADAPPSYYTVLKKGQTYHFYWMAYFGGLQEFAVWQVPTGAASQVQLVMAIDRKGMGSVQTAAATASAPAQPVPARAPAPAPAPARAAAPVRTQAPPAPTPDEAQLAAYLTEHAEDIRTASVRIAEPTDGDLAKARAGARQVVQQYPGFSPCERDVLVADAVDRRAKVGTVGGDSPQEFAEFMAYDIRMILRLPATAPDGRACHSAFLPANFLRLLVQAPR